ncbi:hypothetical protein DBL05_04440 [Pseudomonas putida]|nr:hypothetical protein DBL05_04440 [Pseudomonas putida]
MGVLCFHFSLVWPITACHRRPAVGTLGGYRPPVGAGLPANTGNAGARHHIGLFTGYPALAQGAPRLRGMQRRERQ